MKKITFTFLLVAFSVCFSSVFAQSSRSVKTDDAKKANKRPAATPTPEPAPTEEQLSDEPTLDDGEVIEVSSEIVNFPVKVIDRKGRFVAGLQKESFKILDNKTEQAIEFFNNEQQPFTVALVLDMSYSATFKINEIQSAAVDFISQLRKDDKVMVISFDEQIHVLSEPTSDRQQLQKAIMQTRIGYGTSLYETVDLVVNRKLNKITGRKAIVLFTDGVDTTSESAQAVSNLRDLEETDALVYPIHYNTFNDVQKMKNQTVIVPPTLPGQKIPTSTPNPLPFPFPTGGVGTAGGPGTSAEDYQRAAEYLNDMANRTGGRIYEADSLTNLDRAFAAIASELREFYSIGYYVPQDAQPGEKRRVKVMVNAEKVSVKARENYTVGKKAEKTKK